MNEPATSATALPLQTPPLARALAVLLVVVLAFSFAFTPLRTSHDEFWHLKTGKVLAEQGLPTNEIFTYTAADFEWHNHEWLTQLAMWGAYCAGEGSALGGWRAVITLKTLFIIAAFAGLGVLLARSLRAEGLDPLWALLAAAICTALARRTFYARPPFVSYLLLAGLLWMMTEWRAGRLHGRWLAIWPPLFALWANLHGGWMAGLVVLGAFGGEAALMLLVTLRLRTDWRGALRHGGRVALLGAACAAGTLVNPYGVHLYALAGRVFGDAYLLASIGELMPTDLTFVWVLHGLVLLLAACALQPRDLVGAMRSVAVLVVLLLALRWPVIMQWPVQHWSTYGIGAVVLIAAASRARVPGLAAHLLLGLFFLQQAVMHVRHLSLLGVIVMPLLAYALAQWAAALARPAWSEPVYGVLPDDDAAAAAPPHGHRPRAPRAPRAAWPAGLLLLGALTAFWLTHPGDRQWLDLLRFSPAGGQSYLQRNADLLRGQTMTAGIVQHTPDRLPIASSLPNGVFLVEGYPIEAADFVLRAGLPGPVFNGGNYAGYLIWAWSPEHLKVFTDNRYDIYGGIVIREEHSVLNGWSAEQIAELKRRGVPLGGFDLPWSAVLDKWGIQTVFIPADAMGNVRLAAAGWQRVYEDYSFNIWVRATPQNAAVIESARALPRRKPHLGILRLDQ